MGQIEELRASFEKDRGHMTVFRRPFATARAFVLYAGKWGTETLAATLSHNATRFLLIPAIIAFAAVSWFVIPHTLQQVHARMDANADGRVATAELVKYYAEHFGLAVDPAAVFNGTMSVGEFSEWWNAEQDAVRAPHLHSHGMWREVEYILADVIWWVTLGVLSSVGLGTGMHSGVLFLFPHVFSTCLAANQCGHTNFYTYPVNLFVGPNDRVFQCITPPVADDVDLMARFWKVVAWCVLWGAGTAAGELPPYALSYATAQEGKRNAELEEVSSFDILNRMKAWTLDKISRYGFWAVLLLAAWPNMAFDMCGMACGSFQMPFWTFFGATLIGKALIKVNGQAWFFVVLFSGDRLQRFVLDGADWVARYAPATVDVKWAAAKAVKQLEDLQAKTALRASGKYVETEGSSASVLQVAFQWVVIALVAWFALSIVDTFAQKWQEGIDERCVAAIEAVKKKKKKATGEVADEIITSTRRTHDTVFGPRIMDALTFFAAAALAVAGRVLPDADLAAFSTHVACQAAAWFTLGALYGFAGHRPLWLLLRVATVAVSATFVWRPELVAPFVEEGFRMLQSLKAAAPTQ